MGESGPRFNLNQKGSRDRFAGVSKALWFQRPKRETGAGVDAIRIQ